MVKTGAERSNFSGLKVKSLNFFSYLSPSQIAIAVASTVHAAIENFIKQEASLKPPKGFVLGGEL